MAGDEEKLPTDSDSGKPYRPPRGIAGEDLGRILALSDGVFAFALTLLALTLTVPVFDQTGLTNRQVSSTLAAFLQHDYNAFFGYVFAFIMIGIWWVVHNRTFQWITRYDSALIWINMILLLQIAVMPFVMGVYSDFGSTQVAIALFAAIQVTLGITTTVMWDYARRAKLLKTGIPPDIARIFTHRGLLTSAVFAVSIGVTYINLDAAQLCWIGTFVVQRFLYTA